MIEDRVPMDVTVGCNAPAFSRLMRALVRHRCSITDSFMLTSIDTARPHHSVFLRVHVPADAIDAFRDEVRPQEMRPPPLMGVLDMHAPPPPPRYCVKCGKPENEHPYRHMFAAHGATP